MCQCILSFCRPVVHLATHEDLRQFIIVGLHHKLTRNVERIIGDILIIFFLWWVAINVTHSFELQCFYYSRLRNSILNHQFGRVLHHHQTRMTVYFRINFFRPWLISNLIFLVYQILSFQFLLFIFLTFFLCLYKYTLWLFF